MKNLFFIANLGRDGGDFYMSGMEDFNTLEEFIEYIMEIGNPNPMYDLENEFIYYYDYDRRRWDSLDKVPNYEKTILYFSDYNLSAKDVEKFTFTIKEYDDDSYKVFKSHKTVKLLLPDFNKISYQEFCKEYKKFIEKWGNYVIYLKKREDFLEKSKFLEENVVLQFSTEKIEKNDFLSFIAKNKVFKEGNYIYIYLASTIRFGLFAKVRNNSKLEIPKEFAGLVIGKNGENIKKIKQLLKEKGLNVNFLFSNDSEEEFDEVMDKDTFSVYRTLNLIGKKDGNYVYEYSGKYASNMYIVSPEKIDSLTNNKYIVDNKSLNIPVDGSYYFIVEGELKSKNGKHYFYLKKGGPHYFACVNWGGAFSTSRGELFNIEDYQKVIYKKIASSNNGRLGNTFYVFKK